MPGVSVMGNAYPATSNPKPCASASVREDAACVREDAAWDEVEDTERALLLEENARLRALVVKLSDIVLRNVVERK